MVTDLSSVTSSPAFKDRVGEEVGDETAPLSDCFEEESIGHPLISFIKLTSSCDGGSDTC